MTSPVPTPTGELSGYRVGITAHRRAEEQAGMLARHGAEVVLAPALQLVPVDQDAEVVAATRQAIAQQPDVVIITTAYGLRRWQETAASIDLADEFLAMLDRARIVCRGSKSQGQVVGLGLRRPETVDGRTADLVAGLVAEGIDGRRVALQLHGLADEESVAGLRAAGAEVMTVAPYRWLSADDGQRLGALVRDVVAGRVHVLTFTAAPAVDAMFSTAREIGLDDDLVRALSDGTATAAAIGPVTAVPLQDLGIEPLMPERFRLGSFVRAIGEFAERELTIRCTTRRGPLEVRGFGYALDGGFHALDDGTMAELRRLARERPEDVDDWLASRDA